MSEKKTREEVLQMIDDIFKSSISGDPHYRQVMKLFRKAKKELNGTVPRKNQIQAS